MMIDLATLTTDEHILWIIAREVGKETSCIGKICHATKELAIKEVSRMNKKNLLADSPYYGKIVCYYPCPHCGSWHVGRKPTKKEVQNVLFYKRLD